MWLFYHRLMLNTVLRHSNILASFKSRDNAILNVFIQYQWWFKSEFKGLWIKLTKRFLALCFLLQILDYYFFQIKTMLSLGFKAEIQALSSISFNFLSETYLPVKIKHGRWIWCQNYHLAYTVLHIYSHLRKQWQHLFEGIIVTRATDFWITIN